MPGHTQRVFIMMKRAKIFHVTSQVTPAHATCHTIQDEVVHGSINKQDIDAIVRAEQILPLEPFDSIIIKAKDSLLVWYTNAHCLDANATHIGNSICLDDTSKRQVAEDIYFHVFHDHFNIVIEPAAPDGIQRRSGNIPVWSLFDGTNYLFKV